MCATRISKPSHQPIPPPRANAAIVDLTAPDAPGSDIVVEEDIYLIMLDHTNPDLGEETTTVLAVCDSLEEANRQARTCLEAEYGGGLDWEEYNEDVEVDGSVRI